MIVVPFLPKHELDTLSNLNAYVQHVRDNTIFFRGEKAIDWEDHKWDLTYFYPTTGNVQTKAIFTDKPFEKGEPFIQPFMDEAKALIADFLRQSKTRESSKLIGLFRVIYKFIPQTKNGKSINSLSDAELYAIELSISKLYQDPYCYCRLLERLVHNILEPANITKSRLSWRSGQKHQNSNKYDLVGERNRVANTANRKIPDLRCIIDLASVFSNSKHEPDLVITSWFAISMYAPSRINEVLTLPVKCERYDDDTSGSGHGIAWLPEKNGESIVKRAASEESAAVARKAIQRLIELGKNARKAAKWYEAHPDSLFLPKQFEHLRGQPVTLYEMGMIIGRSKGISSSNTSQFGIEVTKLICTDPSRTNSKNWRRLYTFESLEKYVLKKLPYGWPYADQRTKLKFSEALFTMPFDVLRGYSDTCNNIPQFVTPSMVTSQLGRQPAGNTIFARNNLIDPNTGQPWKLASHQPRHLLNTIAQSKFLSQELIAFWSGRKSVKQNDYYDHTSQEFIIESYLRLEENAPKELIVTGPLADKVDVRAENQPISRDEALKEELAAFHMTKYGYCRHDFSLTPCPKDKWCNNCGEAYFAKGDTRQIEMAKKEIERFNISLAQANQAKLDGEFGVDQWIEKLELDLYRASLKLKKLTDHNIEDGTLVTLPPPKNSQSKAGLSMEIRRAET